VRRRLRRRSWLHALGPAGLVAILIADRWLPDTSSYAVRALIDEPAHLFTTVIVVMSARAVSKGELSAAWMIGGLIAGNLIDADHVPQVLGSYVITAGTPRPYSHSLATVAGLLIVSGATRGRISLFSAGAAVGVAGHLFRDMATGLVPLAWPVSTRGFGIPYWTYASTLAVLALTPLAGRVARGIIWVRADPERSPQDQVS
jgi:inner membrane protein